MDVDWVGPNCYLGDGSVGVLSTSNTGFFPAFGTSTGWDFATGIGTVNAANLVNNWPVTARNFTLSAAPASLTLTQGTSGSATITITPQNGFSSPVGLSVSGLPNGVTASFNPGSAASASVLTITASSIATIGTATVKITGTCGGLTQQTALTLTVNPAGSFTLSASPSSLSVVQGKNVTNTISINPLNGFNSMVALSASGLPSGVTASFSPSSTSNDSALTLASATAAVGTFTVTIKGVSANLTTATVSLTVTSGPNFALSTSPSYLSVARGTNGKSTITIAPLNGFTGSVNLSASGLPGRVSPSLTPNPATSSSTLTLTVGRRANTGTFTVTITGTSGALTHKTTITLVVQ